MAGDQRNMPVVRLWDYPSVKKLDNFQVLHAGHWERVEDEIWKLRDRAHRDLFGMVLDDIPAEFWDGDEQFETVQEASEFCLENGFDLRKDHDLIVEDWLRWTYFVEATVEGHVSFDPSRLADIRQQEWEQKLATEAKAFRRKRRPPNR